MTLGDDMKSRMHEAVSRMTRSFDGMLRSSSTEEDDTEDPDCYTVREARARDNWRIYQLMSSFFPEDGESQEESSKYRGGGGRGRKQ